jgi:hypothetical protein
MKCDIVEKELKELGLSNRIFKQALEETQIKKLNQSIRDNLTLIEACFGYHLEVAKNNGGYIRKGAVENLTKLDKLLSSITDEN